MVKCERIPPELLLSPSCFEGTDYIVVIGWKDYSDEIIKWRENLRARLSEKYNIRENTCMADMLKLVTIHSGVEDEYIPVEFFYDLNWPRESIRENIEKLKEWKIVEACSKEDLPLTYKEFLRKLGIYERFSEFLRPTFKADLNKLHEEAKFFIERVACVSEEEMRRVDVDEIVEMKDVRGKSVEEKFETLMRMRKQYKPKLEQYTDEERMKIVEKLVEKIKQKSYVNSAFIVGSVARGKCTPEGDVDVLIVTEYCPGEASCDIYSYAKPPLDIFCYTTKELEEMRRKKAFILSATIPLFEKVR